MDPWDPFKGMNRWSRAPGSTPRFPYFGPNLVGDAAAQGNAGVVENAAVVQQAGVAGVGGNVAVHEHAGVAGVGANVAVHEHAGASTAANVQFRRALRVYYQQVQQHRRQDEEIDCRMHEYYGQLMQEIDPQEEMQEEEDDGDATVDGQHDQQVQQDQQEADETTALHPQEWPVLGAQAPHSVAKAGKEVPEPVTKAADYLIEGEAGTSGQNIEGKAGQRGLKTEVRFDGQDDQELQQDHQEAEETTALHLEEWPSLGAQAPQSVAKAVKEVPESVIRAAEHRVEGEAGRSGHNTEEEAGTRGHNIEGEAGQGHTTDCGLGLDTETGGNQRGSNPIVDEATSAEAVTEGVELREAAPEAAVAGGSVNDTAGWNHQVRYLGRKKRQGDIRRDRRRGR